MIFVGLFASFLMGGVLGLLGGGGSILTVPIMVYLFKIPPADATTYSLFVVGVTSLVGTWKYYQHKEVIFLTIIRFAIPSFFGVYFSRGLLLPSIPRDIINLGSFVLTKDTLVMLIFSVVMMIVARKMLLASNSNKPSAKKFDQPAVEQIANFSTNSKLALQGLMIGILTGFIGAGGGFLITPALVLLAGLSMRQAIGTSLGIISLNSFFGFLISYGGQSSNTTMINWNLLGTVALVAIIGILAGSMLSQRIQEAKLKTTFGYLVLIMGLFVFVKEIIF